MGVSVMRALVLLLALALAWGQAWATDRWCSASGAGTNSGTSAANACVFTTANVLTAFGGALTRGDNLYICGTLGSSNGWAPGGVGGTSGYFTVSGDPDVTGCDAGGWDYAGNVGTPVQIGGGGRNFIKLSKVFIRNCGGNCMTWGGSDNWIDQSTFDTADDNLVRVTVAASRLLVTRSTFSNWGDDSTTAEAAINIEPADSIAVSTVTIGGSLANGNSFTGNGTGRWGVSCYPNGTTDNGTATGCEISYNTFAGSYAHGPVNIARDSDNAVVRRNDMSAVEEGGGAVIHIGGQGTYGACTYTTDNALIEGNIVTGGSINAENPSDGSGIFPDECSVGTRVFRNVSYGNSVAGLYLNDADNVTAIGNVLWGNGDNAVHVHGAGINFVAQHNSSYHTATNPSGAADQGTDSWQIDGSVGTGTTLTNNAIKCASTVRKCVDADVAITETYNAIYHPTSADRAEGFTPDATDLSSDPLFTDSAPTSADGFCLDAGSLVLAAGTYIGAWATGLENEDLGKSPAIGARRTCEARRAVATRRIVGERRAP